MNGSRNTSYHLRNVLVHLLTCIECARGSPFPILIIQYSLKWVVGFNLDGRPYSKLVNLFNIAILISTIVITI